MKRLLFFDGAGELVDRVTYYLSNPAARDAIRMAGHQRAVAGHTLDARARIIIQELTKI